MRNTALRIAASAVPAARTPFTTHPSVGRLIPATLRHVSTSPSRAATPLPITATGPPPAPPSPAEDRVGEARRKAALISAAKELRPSTKASSPLRRRFWKDVHVKQTPEGGYQILLDARPIRTPSKSIITIPASKPALAHAIAIEWDNLESAQAALKQYRIPLTSIVSRAQDILEADAAGDQKIRDDILIVMLRYLDTDTLLCWAPAHYAHDAHLVEQHESRTESLRDLQIRVAERIIAYLNKRVWPGIDVRPVLDGDTIMPMKQSDTTREVIRGWMAGLPAYELAALERAVLAGKSLLVGARLVVEWSEHFRATQKGEVAEQLRGPAADAGDDAGARFGIEEASHASSLEVRWQTGMWGEVEDSHDVDNEDMRRQLGQAVLLVSGTK